MRAKKIISFLLLAPAVNKRNLTSLALVAVFFGVYVASGGKVTSLPRVAPGQGFGGLGQGQEVQVTGDVQSESGSSTSASVDRLPNAAGTNNTAVGKQPSEIEPAPDDKRNKDTLSDLEERIRKLKAAKAAEQQRQ
jgi:hypothetical protein